MTMDHKTIRNRDAKATVQLMIAGIDEARKKQIIEKYHDPEHCLKSVRAQKIAIGDWLNHAKTMLLNGATPEEMDKVSEHMIVLLNAVKHELNVTKSYNEKDLWKLVVKYCKINGISPLEKRRILVEEKDKHRKKFVEQVKYMKGKGQTCAQIAYELGLAESTVRNLLKE